VLFRSENYEQCELNLSLFGKQTSITCSTWR